ncbi:protein Wnt-11-like [Misgurnus anguillicaudatus]|uniref:protein Wnt-11-like n=1 Tax=Misgurnus anguillicaudatus TaxID=75329 RepID=UPI003CCF44EB
MAYYGVCLLFITTCLIPCTGISWIGLTVNGSPVAWNQTRHCKILDGLVPEQRLFCKHNLELMDSIVHAAKLTKSVCQSTFNNMPWNCSSILKAPYFTLDLAKGTREAAFVHSLSSAMVSHVIAHACASGELPNCPSTPALSGQTAPDFKWGGCGNDVLYGLKMGSVFSDAPMKEQQRPALRLMQLHNNAVGRRVLMNSLEMKCKCHGVSGLGKTCWKDLQDIISAKLKSKYLSATKVIPRKTGPQRQLVLQGLGMRPLGGNELIYLVN